VLIFESAVAERQALTVVVNKAAAAIQVGVGMAADTILVFEEFERCIRGRMGFIELINAELAVCKAATVLCEFIIEVSL